MGYFCEKGLGIEKDHEKAFYWYEKAAKQKFSAAQNNLAVMYATGNTVKKDYKKAIYWYEKVANQNNKDSLNSLGHFYANGIGVDFDYNKAEYYYKESIKYGGVTAKNNLIILNKEQNKNSFINNNIQFTGSSTGSVGTKYSK